MARASFLLRYLWAAPYTVLGLSLGALAVLFGATARRHHGVVEVFGGRIGAGLARLPEPLRFSAMTLGHVILAVDRSALSQLRLHEHVHESRQRRSKHGRATRRPRSVRRLASQGNPSYGARSFLRG